MKQVKTIFVALVATVSFAACSKDKTEPSNNNNGNNNTTSKTPKELIVGTWKPVSQIYNGQEVIEECTKDNTITVNADGTYRTDLGAIKCSSSQTQNEDGKWNFDNYPSVNFKLNTAQDNGSTVTVKTLDNTTFRYDQTESGHTYTMTWTRQ